MRGIISLFLAVIVASFAMAHGSHGGGGDSSGLSVGVGFSMDIDIPKEGDTEAAPSTSLTLSYCEGFFDDALDFDIGLSYIFTHKKGFFELGEIDVIDPSYNDNFYQQILCLEAGLAYTLDLDYFSTLSFFLENETDFYLAPRMKGENNVEGELSPGIKLGWDLNFGGIYVSCGFPLQYVSYFKEEDFGVGNDIGLGWQSKFGLSIDFVSHFALTGERGFDCIDAIISYEIPCELSIGNFAFYVNCEIDDIGSEEGICIVPAIGIRYTF